MRQKVSALGVEVSTLRRDLALESSSLKEIFDEFVMSQQHKQMAMDALALSEEEDSTERDCANQLEHKMVEERESKLEYVRRLVNRTNGPDPNSKMTSGCPHDREFLQLSQLTDRVKERLV